MEILKSIQSFLINSIEKIILIVIIVFFTVLFAKLVKKLIDRYFKNAAKIMKTDPTHHSFMKHFMSALIYVVGMSIAIYTIPSLRSIAVSIFASAGLLAVVLGFAAQQAFSNVISGVFIVIFKPFKVGDRVKIKAELSGVVEDITLRHTVIRNFENKRFIIPNSVMSSEIIENANFGDEEICKYIDFGISYDSDLDKAMKIMRQEALKHPNHIDHRTDDEKKAKAQIVIVRVLGFGDFSVNLRAWVWAKTPGDAFVMGCDLNKSIKQRFDKEGIEIPYPYRTVVYKKDMAKPRKKK